jgi:hypothetical protein
MRSDVLRAGTLLRRERACSNLNVAIEPELRRQQ